MLVVLHLLFLQLRWLVRGVVARLVPLGATRFAHATTDAATDACVRRMLAGS